MLQGTLLSEYDLKQQSVSVGNIKAMFVNNFDGFYDVSLEFNSQKFFIKVSKVFDEIVSFEILCVKGFLELSKRVVELLRSLVQHLFYRID